MMIATPKGAGHSTTRISNRSDDKKHPSSVNTRRRRRANRRTSSSSKKPVLLDSDPNQNATDPNATGPCSAVSRIRGKHSFRSLLNDLQSPSKKHKREKQQQQQQQSQKKAKLTMATPVQSTPMFESGVMDENCQVQQTDVNNNSDELMILENTSNVSEGSKETASTVGTRTDDSHNSGNGNHHHNDNQSMVSGTETETSSVSHLRHWLDDFGQQNKKHFETASSIGSAPPDAKKVMRSRVTKAKTEVPPPATPATRIVRTARKVDTVPHPRARATPVRIKTRRHSDVEATNDGYKSVAKLSAWLADDPTKSKSQVTSIRRGANVIAKSRAFDKGLANVIIEENSIRNGNVKLERRRLEAECDGVESSTVAGSKLETTSSISVSQQKQWLASAFKKEESAVDRAKTELVTDREKQEDASVRAKQLWRQRSGTSGKAAVQAKEQATDPSTKAKEMWRERSAAEKRIPSISPVRKNTHTRCPSSEPRRLLNEEKMTGSQPPNVTIETEEELGFREARKILVQRSKKNGHNVEVLTKVALRKAKFERIERENTRRRSSSHGMLKSHWEEVDTAEDHPNNPSTSAGYVKSFVENPKPKKTFDELP